MKRILILIATLAAVWACGNRNHSGHSHDHGTAHVHGADCDHDHEHDHGSAHVHGADCDHDHEHDHGSAHVHGEECDHDHGPAAGEHSDDPEDIIFTAAQAAMTDFEVRPVVRGPFRRVIKASGVISPAQGDRVSIVAPAEGIVALRGRNLTEGARVGAGAVLFSVSSARIAGGDQVAALRAAYNRARADYERAVALREDNIVSQAELDAVTAEYESARLQYESLAGSDNGSGVSVTSPIAGFVYGIEVTEGQYVERGQLLATVVRDGTMQLRAEVPQRYYSDLSTVTDANFTVPSSTEVYNVSQLGGSVVSVGGAVAPGSPLVPVVFRFGYRPGILAGSFAEVNLLGVRRDDVLTLPLSAITEQQGLYYVYVNTGGDVYHRREVTVGGDDGRDVEILSGLTEGERVVVRGAVSVRMASASGAIPHSHEH